MNKLTKFFLNRLKETSTWRGIVVLLTSFGLALSPEQANAIIALGLAVVGVVGVFFPDVPADEPAKLRDPEVPPQRDPFKVRQPERDPRGSFTPE